MYFKTIPEAFSFLSFDKSRLTLCSYILSRLAATAAAAVSEVPQEIESSADGESAQAKIRETKAHPREYTRRCTRDTLSPACVCMRVPLLRIEKR